MDLLQHYEAVGKATPASSTTGPRGRGLTASLVAVTSNEERGLAYRHFLENAAALPSVVGAHWFQWMDQPVTGRFDGECYRIGLVDITDIPYDDFLAPVKETTPASTTFAGGR